MRLHRLWSALCLIPAALNAQPAAFDASAFDVLFTRALAQWNVPGFSVAIVRNDSLLYSKGFGIRRTGDSAPVTERTVFYAASVTKAFTAAAIGQLADSGKLRVNEPVRRVLPEFALADSSLSASLTASDLLTQRTALPRADLLLFAGDDDATFLRRLSALAANPALRHRLAYNNQMYQVLGIVASRVGGRPFASLLEDRLLAPLGMTSSDAAGAGGARSRDVAAAHRWRDGRIESFTGPSRPPTGAGAINTSAHDLAQWARAVLNGGRVGTTRVFSEGIAQALRTPLTIATPVTVTPGATMAAYAMGGYVHDFHGHLVVQQVGQGEGSSAVVTLVPRSRLAVVVLANLQGTLLPQAVATETVKRLLNLGGPDWIAELRTTDSLARAMAGTTTGATARSSVSEGRAPSSVAKRNGVFAHRLYGDVSLDVAGDSLRLAYGPWIRASASLQGATPMELQPRSEAARIAIAGATVEFRGASGDTLLLRLAGESIPFVRKLPP